MKLALDPSPGWCGCPIDEWYTGKDRIRDPRVTEFLQTFLGRTFLFVSGRHNWRLFVERLLIPAFPEDTVICWLDREKFHPNPLVVSALRSINYLGVGRGHSPGKGQRGLPLIAQISTVEDFNGVTWTSFGGFSMHEHLLPAKTASVHDPAVRHAVERYVDQALGYLGVHG